MQFYKISNCGKKSKVLAYNKSTPIAICQIINFKWNIDKEQILQTYQQNAKQVAKQKPDN